MTLDFSFASDLTWDLRRPLPFRDNTVSVIYCSHVLEHFYYNELIRLLKDFARVLKEGGTISVCVPDASIFVRGYLEPDNFDRDLLAYEPARISDQRMDILNYVAYMDGHHRYMFDIDNLIRVLVSAGFVSVHARPFDAAVDLPERKADSIYAIGIKP